MPSGLNGLQNNELKVDNMHFQPQTGAVYSPGNISNTPIKKYLAGLDPQSESQQDAYIPQDQMGAMGMTPETAMALQRAKNSAKNTAMMIGATIIGGVLIFSKKARVVLKELPSKAKQIFSKIKPAEKKPIISTMDDLRTFSTELRTKLDTKPIQRADMQDIKIRFLSHSSSEIEDTLKGVKNLAQEYSHSKDGTPALRIRLEQGEEALRGRFEKAISKNNFDEITPEQFKKIESVELVFEKQGGKHLDTNVNLDVEVRKFDNQNNFARWCEDQGLRMKSWFSKEAE